MGMVDGSELGRYAEATDEVMRMKTWIPACLLRLMHHRLNCIG
jgi:hypothetical protein